MARGRYTIVGKLADGGMAEIFLARQHGVEGFQKPVVLKRVLSAFSADPQFRNMFIDEAHISMTLSHGNIVQVLDAGLAGERMFLALELVEGWDLSAVMARAQAAGAEHPWPPSLALFVAAQTCRALAYAHGKRGVDGRPLGIVHRDVSPANILLSEQGEVKLTDFGIAKAERKREQTAAGVIKGKIGFMSPEQARGQSLDARADIFAVGAVLYLMLTGRKPFEGSSDLESLMRAQKADYVSPESLNPYLSPDATAIVNRAMRREVQARYQSADLMLVDLERVLREQYHSAGQSELKAWLAELARRDGQQPMGRVVPGEPPVGGATAGDPDHPGAAPAMFVDRAGDLSAGTSVELSDLDLPLPPPPASSSLAPTVRAGDGAALAAVLGRPGRRDGPGAPTPGREPSGARASSPPPPSGPAAEEVAPDAGAASGPAQEPRAAALAPTEAAPVQVMPRVPTAGLNPRQFSRRTRTGLGFVAGAACMLGAVVAIRFLAGWAGQETAGVGGAGGRALATPSVVAVAATGALAAGPAPDAGGDARALALAPGGDLPGGGATVDAAGVSAGADAGASVVAVAVAVRSAGERDPEPGGGPVQPSEPVPVARDEDESKLLARATADRATVIGEDEAEHDAAGPAEAEAGASGPPAQPTAASASRARDRGGAAVAGPAPTRRPAAGAPEAARTRPTAEARAPAAAAPPRPVSVRITTRPLGAIVRTKKQVIGRTPISIRFKPGSTYELTFVKSGYLTVRRPLAVRPGRPGTLAVALKKAPPAPTPSLSQRLRQRLLPGR